MFPDRQPVSTHKLACVLYGISGVGKTSLAAHFPDCAFIIDPQEGGIRDLVSFRKCPAPREIMVAEGWEHLLALSEKVATRREIKTVCYDSATGIEQLCFRYHCKKYYDDDWSSKGFFSYMQGPKNAAKRDWPEFIQAMEVIRESGKNVIFIAHSQVKPFSNPEGPDYDRYTPYLDKETWAATHRWASLVMFYKFEDEITKTGPKAKAKGDARRIICTEHTSHYDAKNRYGLSPIINAGDSPAESYKAFITAYNRCLN